MYIDDMTIRFIYTILVGLFLAIFVGVGISAFYPSPKYPEMPAVLKFCTAEVKDFQQYGAFKTVAEAFDKEERLYRAQSLTYNKNVSILSVIAAVLLVVASLTFTKKLLLIADGLLLGGVFVLLYSVMRCFASEDSKFQFVIVSIGLFISLALGYLKLIKSNVQ